MSSQGHSGSASGGQLEETTDYTAETDRALADISSTTDLPTTLATLAALEKKCRVGNDNKNLARVCAAAVTACRDDPDAVIQTLQTYASKRSQKVAAIRALVETALPWCVQEDQPHIPVAVTGGEAKAVRDRLVQTLRDMTEGKLFLERERAQLTRAYATIQVCVNVSFCAGGCVGIVFF